MRTIVTLLALFAFAGTAVVVPQTNAIAATQYANKGKVLEVIDSNPMYTYMQVSTDKGPLWLAASKTKVAKGQTIGFGGGAVMTNFYSKGLNRTFDTIIFLDRVEVLK